MMRAFSPRGSEARAFPRLLPVVPSPALRGSLLRRWSWYAMLPVVFVAVSIPVNAVLYGVPLYAAFLLGFLQAGLVPIAVSFPRIAVVLSILPLFLFPILSQHSVGAPWPVPVISLLAHVALIVVLAFTTPWRTAIAAWAVGLVAVAAAIGLTPGKFGALSDTFGSAIPFAAISAATVAIALLLAQRASIRAQLERERKVVAVEQGRREVMEERNRIAREMHDVVAHGMSVIQVQASSAKYRLSALDPVVAAEFDDIGATARSALAEMRQLLGVLRNDDAHAELGPQPGLVEIPALVDSVRKTGAPVSLEWSVSASDVAPPAVALAAYRTVQESLSNAVRHSPGATTRVVVTRGEEAVEITVENDAPPVGDPDPAIPAYPEASPIRTGGHGLRGMQERIQLVGGILEHGPTADGGFRVSARLPVPAATPTPSEQS